MNFTNLNKKDLPEDLFNLIESYENMRNKGDICLNQFFNILTIAIDKHRVWFGENIKLFAGEAEKISRLFSVAEKDENFNRIKNILEIQSKKWELLKNENTCLREITSNQIILFQKQSLSAESFKNFSKTLVYGFISIGIFSINGICYYLNYCLSQYYNLLDDLICEIQNSLSFQLPLPHMPHVQGSNIYNFSKIQNAFSDFSQAVKPDRIPAFIFGGIAVFCTATFFYSGWKYYQSQQNLAKKQGNLDDQVKNMLPDINLKEENELENLIEPLKSDLGRISF